MKFSNNMMTKKSAVKKNDLGIYLNSYPPVKEGETIFGRDIAVNDFLKGLLVHGKPRNYQFYQTFDFFKNTFNDRRKLLDIGNQRKDISITIKDINDIKEKNSTFDLISGMKLMQTSLKQFLCEIDIAQKPIR